jgi:hypothetical protein
MLKRTFMPAAPVLARHFHRSSLRKIYTCAPFFLQSFYTPVVKL